MALTPAIHTPRLGSNAAGTKRLFLGEVSDIAPNGNYIVSNMVVTTPPQMFPGKKFVYIGNIPNKTKIGVEGTGPETSRAYTYSADLEISHPNAAVLNELISRNGARCVLLSEEANGDILVIGDVTLPIMLGVAGVSNGETGSDVGRHIKVSFKQGGYQTPPAYMTQAQLAGLI